MLLGGCRCRCRAPRRAAPAPVRSRRPAVDPHVTTTSPSLGELHRVADQVQQDLAQPAASPTSTRRARPGRRRSTSSRPLAGRGRRISVERRPPRSSRRSNGSALELQPAGLDLGEVQDVVDDREQRLAADVGSSRRTRAARPSSSVSASRPLMPMTRSSACGSRGSWSPGTCSWPRWRCRRLRAARASSSVMSWSIGVVSRECSPSTTSGTMMHLDTRRGDAVLRTRRRDARRTRSRRPVRRTAATSASLAPQLARAGRCSSPIGRPESRSSGLVAEQLGRCRVPARHPQVGVHRHDREPD